MNLAEIFISRNALRPILPPPTMCHSHISKTSYFTKFTPGQRNCSCPFSISAAIKNGSFSVFAAMSRPIPGPSFKTRASLFLCTIFQPRGNSCITSLLVWGSATSKEDVKKVGCVDSLQCAACIQSSSRGVTLVASNGQKGKGIQKIKNFAYIF